MFRSLATAYVAARNGRAIQLNHENAKACVNRIPTDFTGKIVLDVACGHEDPFFAERLQTAKHVIGLDGNEAEVKRNRCIQEGIAGNIHAMPLPDACVDLVVSVDTIEHSPEPGKFLAECFRVLRPGGEAVFTTPNLLGYKNAFAKICGKSVFDFFWKSFHNRQLDYDTCYRCNTKWAFRRRARQAGFEFVELRYVPEISWFFAGYPTAFAAAHAYNLVTGAVGLKGLWGYMVVRLAKP